jgi:ferrous iron transport protein A
MGEHNRFRKEAGFMHKNLIPLSILPLGRKAKVKELASDGIVRRRMLDLGLISDTEVEALQKSPSGDPTAYHIRGAVIALRSEEASKILVEV